MKKEPFYHIIFWVLYILIWSAQDYVYFNNYKAVMLRNAFTLPSLLAIVYLNIYLLLPRFLFKKAYYTYTFLLLFSILFSGISGFFYVSFFTEGTLLQRKNIGTDSEKKIRDGAKIIEGADKSTFSI